MERHVDVSLVDRPRAGAGRSGPRRKTGCLTCRKRKVRCDETKPTCRHCRRLGVGCVYMELQSRSSTATATSAPASASSTVRQETPGPSPSPHDGGLAGQDMEGCSIPSMLPTSAGYDGEAAGSLAMHNFLPYDAQAFDFPAVDPSALFAEFTDGLEGLFSDPSPSQLAPESDGHSGPYSFHLPENFDRAGLPYGTRLQQHFMSLACPPRFIISVDYDWKGVRDNILTMAETSSSVTNAIYAFSDAHLSLTEGRQPRYAADYYDQASLEVEQSMGEDVGADDLKASFAAIFFLIYVELLVPIRSSLRPAHFHLRTAHTLIKKYRSRLSSWRGLGRRIVTWLVLFDSKATLAGREGELLEDNLAAEDNLGATDEVLQPLSSSDAVYNALNKDLFAFYLKIEQFTRRIIQIDKWHRPRGSLNDEVEVLQIGKQIDADMDAQWSSRPALLDKAIYPGDLAGVLQEPFANRLYDAVRQYLAIFHAHRVYLHRVAFRRYPRQAKVDQAMQVVLELAKVGAAERILSPAFKWPLFMVGLEADTSDRQWIEGALGRMAAASDLDHTGAARALQVLQVISRRQDAGDQVVDSISVRNELFSGSLGVI